MNSTPTNYAKKTVEIYSYQAFLLLPQFIILPVIALIATQSHLVIYAKYFIVINFIGLISDWGQSTLGSQKIAVNIGNKAQISQIFSNSELVRWIVGFLAIVASVGIHDYLFSCTSYSEKTTSLLVLLCGGCSVILLPHWLVLGANLYRMATYWLLVIRCTSIPLLFAFSNLWDPAYALLAYFGVLILWMIAFRRAVIQYIIFFGVKSNRQESINVFLSGFKLTVGGLACYGFLATGVLIVDRWGTESAAAAFVLADRALSTARAIYTPAIQYMVVNYNNNRNSSKLMLISTVYTGFVWVSGYFILAHVVNNALSLQYFNILMCGFLLLGAAHKYVSLDILGGGKLNLWLTIVFLGLLLYITLSAIAIGYSRLEVGLSVCLSIISAEALILILGIISCRK
jgi:hypothetical protein